MMGNYHVRCEGGEKLTIISKAYLFLSNRAQYMLIRMLAAQHQNICVVGDGDQCLLPSTLIETKDGMKTIDTVQEGDQVLAASGWGKTSFAAVDHVMSKDYSGPVVKLTTKLGKVITATPNHVMFARLQNSANLYYVYLMYKKNKGYRIGKTRGVRAGNRQGSLVSGLQIRTNQEVADKVWILATTDSEEKASYLEQYYAFKYGIPTMVLHVRGRRMALQQAQIDQLYEEIDTEERVVRLMEDLLLFEEYPHYRAGAVQRGEVSRKLVSFTMFGDLRQYQGRAWHDHRVQLISSEHGLRDKAVAGDFPVRRGKGNTWRVETARKDYEQGIAYVKQLAALEDLDLVYKARLVDEKGEGKGFTFTPAGHIHPGMIIPVEQDGKVILDVVTDRVIMEYKGQVYDLSVPNHRNFVADDIIVHNSIYGWRGADITNILNFEEDYPNAKVVKLEQNYRSTKRILLAANTVIKNNFGRKAKNLWTENDEGRKIGLFNADSEHSEAFFIVDKIKKAIAEGKTYRDFAVLYRTNAQSRVVEEVFVKSNIPYGIVGGTKFYDRKEVKDVLAYLRLISNPDDDISLQRIINVPKRGIGQASIDKIADYAGQHGISMYRAIMESDQLGLSGKAAKTIVDFAQMIQDLEQMNEYLSVTELTEEVLKRTEYREMYKAEGTLEAKARLENIDEFLSVTLDFENKNEDKTLTSFLTELALVADIDSVDEEDTDNKVIMMTLHSAKGLEFPVVFLIGLEEGVFPHSRALFEDSEMEEERRLAYVGITRAEEQLYLTRAKMRTLYGRTTMNPASRFLSEIPEELLEGDEPKATPQSTPARTFQRPAVGAVGAQTAQRGADVSADWKLGDKVEHGKWGQGTVVSMKGQGDSLELDIAFSAPTGIKKLLAKFAPIKRL